LFVTVLCQFAGVSLWEAAPGGGLAVAWSKTGVNATFSADFIIYNRQGARLARKSVVYNGSVTLGVLGALAVIDLSFER
jgi:hypothetical protein